MSYPKYLRAKVFDPAGMRDSFVNESPIPPLANTALSYGEWPFFKPIDAADFLNCNTVYGDGSVFASVEDLAHWNFALDDDKLISAAARKVVFTPGLTNDGNSTEYGFGWRVQTFAERPVYQHGGKWGGYTNLVARFPKSDLKVALLSNSDSTPNEAILTKILDLLDRE